MLKGQKSENITETHQNEAQKAKITAQRASEKVGTVLKGQKSENLRLNQSSSNIDMINSPKKVPKSKILSENYFKQCGYCC